MTMMAMIVKTHRNDGSDEDDKNGNDDENDGKQENQQATF